MGDLDLTRSCSTLSSRDWVAGIFCCWRLDVPILVFDVEWGTVFERRGMGELFASAVAMAEVLGWQRREGSRRG